MKNNMKCERESVHACVSEHKVGWLSDSDCQDVITHTHTRTQTGCSRRQPNKAERPTTSGGCYS